jgi:hypothetical protein
MHNPDFIQLNVETSPGRQARPVKFRDRGIELAGSPEDVQKLLEILSRTKKQ